MLVVDEAHKVYSGRSDVRGRLTDRTHSLGCGPGDWAGEVDPRRVK